MPVSTRAAERKKSNSARFFDVYGSLLTFVLMIVVFSILSPYFRTGENYINLLIQSMPLLLLAIGVSFVNLAGETDLSMGGVVGLCASLFCGFIARGHSIGAAAAVSLGAAAGFGLLNGALVAVAGLSSFIVTISTMFLGQGLEYAYSAGISLWVRDHPVMKIVNNRVGPVPLFVIVSLGVFVLVYFIVHQTKTGLHIQSVGLSQDAARFAGIKVRIIKLVMFVLGSLFYALGGIINALRSSGSIIYSGQRLLLPALAITFIAKTILGTKRANVPGLLIGALMLSSVSTAFTLMRIEFYYSLIAQGAILILAAILSVGDRSVILQEDLR
ncbi:MAG: ABC transporter permease [Spirochaetales bacterium]|nr:ABC transporter permease [Spirochaetales bacterium]